MALLTFYDSAWPANPAPATDGVCFYIGGDTPHVWTAAEINAQKARYRLPVYVRSNPPGPGAAADVAAAVQHLNSIGAPHGTLVAWDMETAVDAPYIAAVYTTLRAAGYTLIVYASQSVILGEQNPDGLYWGADWTDRPHLHSPDVMTQYVSFSGYDESDATSTLPFWDTRGGPAPVPPPPAPTPSATYLTAAEVNQIMGQLPVLQNGSSDTSFPHWYVHRIQAILNSVFGNHLTVDGVFGPATEAAVKALQAGAHLTQDGIVGANTWNLLITGA